MENVGEPLFLSDNEHDIKLVERSDSPADEPNYDQEKEQQKQDQEQDDVDSNPGGKFYREYDWKRITGDFFDACGELSLGELVHDELFGLFEAMSAIEMMDPKMDVGMGFSKNEPPPHTFETAVAAGILKLTNFESSELIGIIDALYACLVAWLEGHSLDQILFTCLYIHSPDSIEDKSLKTFCIAIRRIVNTIKDFIIESDVCEEEDFQLFRVNSSYNFYDHLSVPKVVSMIREAEDELLKKSKSDVQPDDTLAIINRLRLMRHLFQSLYLFWPRVEAAPTENEIAEIQRNLSAGLDIIPHIKKTIDKGTQPDPNSEAPNPMGFSPRVNQRNLPPTFPRTAEIKDRLSSFQFIEELLQRLKFACKVVHLRDYHAALNFFIDFSKRSDHCLFSRSVLQILFLNNRKILGTIPFEDCLKESVKNFIAPPVLMARNPLAMHPQAKVCVDAFFSYCKMHPFMYFLQICGYNRARQRDKLARLIQEGFAILQDEAGRVDSYLNVLATKTEAAGQHIAFFGTWTLYHCLRAMSLYLLSGFELELYSVHEYLYIFWYLFEFLFGFIISALTRADCILTEQEHLQEQLNSKGTKQRKSKPKKKKQQKTFKVEIDYNHALQNLCGGYYKAMAGLTKDERIRHPMSKFDNESIRFSHRFIPFANLTSPPPIPYCEFYKMKTCLLRLSSTELYKAATNHFHQARKCLESIQNPDQEMLQLIQVAKVNFVVTSLLSKGHKKDSKSQPNFDFSQHRYFPIIKLN